MKTLTYDENLDLKLDLYETESPEPPLFVYMHGGGLEGGNRSSNADTFKKLQAAGIASASLDYRMYPTAKFPEFIEDCAKAIGFLKSYKKFTKIHSRRLIGGRIPRDDADAEPRFSLEIQGKIRFRDRKIWRKARPIED